MVQGIINDYTLTAIADAIRNKNGTSTTYKPSEFAEQIRALVNDGYNEFEKAIMRSIKEVQNTTSTEIGAFAYSNATDLANVTFTEATVIDSNAFYKCTALEEVYFPKVTHIGSYAFYGCGALKEVTFESGLIFTGRETFHACTSLEKADLGGTVNFYGMDFYGCTALKTLILRNTTNIATFHVNAGSQVFYNTPIASGTGYIYVPSALLSQYKAASAWSAYKNQFRAIEDYPEICG